MSEAPFIVQFRNDDPPEDKYDILLVELQIAEYPPWVILRLENVYERAWLRGLLDDLGYDALLTNRGVKAQKRVGSAGTLQ